MPMPRISPIMNNCLLHALTPELVAIISSRYEEIQGNPAYEVLKTTFINFYQLPDDFSWPNFSKLLSQYNPFDVQIIFGPVLRKVIEENLRDVKEEHPGFDGLTKQQFIQQILTLGENGRYAILDPYSLSPFLTNALGFTLTIDKFGVQEYPSDHPRALVINLKHVGEDEASYHFEREDNPTDYSEDPSSRLKFITDYLNEDGKGETLFLIDLIRRHVQATHAGQNVNPSIEKALENLRIFREKNLELIVEGKEHTRFQAYSSLKNVPGFNLPLYVLASIQDIRKQIIVEMHQKLDNKINDNYNGLEREHLFELSQRICGELEQALIQLPEDANEDEVKSLFVQKLNDFQNKTLVSKGFFEILIEGFVYALKWLLGISQPVFSTTRGFFEQESHEKYIPSNLTNKL